VSTQRAKEDRGTLPWSGADPWQAAWGFWVDAWRRTPEVWADLGQAWIRASGSASPDTSGGKPRERQPSSGVPAWDYWVDAWQRTILFWDVLRQRSDQYYAQKAKAVPHVLSFEHELIMSGRQLPRPVNYGLVRIKPPDGVVVDERKRPFVIVDPRAGPDG